MAQEKWLVSGPKVIDVGLVRTLKVGLVGGQVDIVGHDEPGARIEVHSVIGKDLKISIDGDTLEIDHPQIRWDNFLDVFKGFPSYRDSDRADVSILVPRDVALKFGVVSATGLVSGLVGTANLSTVSGDLVIDGLRGELVANSVNGEVSVRDHEGTIAVHTVNGDVTASGEISNFAADGVSGDVYLDIVGEPAQIRVNTVTGNVTARLAPEIATEYRINTITGRLQLDAAEVHGVRGQYSGKYGTLEGRWLEFKANTVGGNVSVLHAVSA